MAGTDYSQIGNLVTAIIDNQECFLSVPEDIVKSACRDVDAGTKSPGMERPLKRSRQEESMVTSSTSTALVDTVLAPGKSSEVMRYTSKSAEALKPIKISKSPRLYQCPLQLECNFMSSSSIGTLDNHIRRVHLKEPLKCLLCEETNWTNKGMHGHVMKNHADVVAQQIVTVAIPDVNE